MLVYDINNFKFVKEFGDTKYPPKYVTASREFIYVVSTDKQILQYKSADYSFVGITETWDSRSYFQIIDIAVSDENQVFVISQKWPN